ncbi:MAG: DUF512 domain-containing protein [Armatimonadetes bacterium]|nr:DUF512 domain-containing protein [Armatimonadota bacterium]
MPLTIDSILPGSIAAQEGLQANDVIISINENSINDFLDLQFFGAEESLLIKFKNSEKLTKRIFLYQDFEKSLGIIPIPHKCRTCINDCVFCFVDQMPSDLRKSLYLQDDDFRLSLVYGNFITLTNLAQKDYERIIFQKLSPLYISVHTTNPVLHKKLMKYKIDFNILDQLTFLRKNGIELHTQIVIIPGWNDGNEMINTLQDLTSIDVLSIGIVPVGITKYRNSLQEIQTVNSNLAKELIKVSCDFPKTYCSDEIYVLANQQIPPDDFYDSYPQLENGIGMIRLLLENWKRNKNKFINEVAEINENFVFITGKLAYDYFIQIAEEINSTLPNKARVKAISNYFLGESITVTGLLNAKDILEQIDLRKDEIAVISSNIFNTDGFTLDDIHKNELKTKLNGKLFIIDEEFADWELI